jgi:hypothetical protein
VCRTYSTILGPIVTSLGRPTAYVFIAQAVLGFDAGRFEHVEVEAFVVGHHQAV